MGIRTVSIVGVGLIGGSFGLALRKSGFTGRILGVSSPRTLEAALARGVIDEAAPLEEAVPQSELVYLSQPIHRIFESLPKVRELARGDALVTDAGSTKALLVERARELFSEGPWFLGGHPMAGKEKSGVERADPGLFRNATYVLTPLDGRLPQAPVIQDFLAWIEKIGARPLVLPAPLHDEVVAWTSHLPQLISTSLAHCIRDQVGAEERMRIAGPGLRDMTRLAESPYEIWKDIFATNRANLDRALKLYIERLEHFRRLVGSEELEQEFEAAREFRRKFLA